MKFIWFECSGMFSNCIDICSYFSCIFLGAWKMRECLCGLLFDFFLFFFFRKYILFVWFKESLFFECQYRYNILESFKQNVCNLYHVAIKSLLVRNMSDYSWYLINSLSYYSTLISLKLVVSLLHATTQYQLYILDFHLTSLWLQYSNKQGLIYCILSSPVDNA